MEVFTILAVISVLAAVGAAFFLLFYLNRRPLPMKVMNLVWPLTALWSGLLGLAAFFSFGKPGKGMKMPGSKEMNRPEIRGNMMAMDMSGATSEKGSAHLGTKEEGNSYTDKPEGMPMHMDMGQRAFWQKVTLSTFHCGAGCTLADIIGEWIGPLILLPAGLQGIGWMWLLDYILALITGAYFQYAAIRPTLPEMAPGRVFTRALKIDFLSLTSWQIGMYACSYLLLFVLLPSPLPHDTWGFWFVMQLAMVAGFFFSYPVNWLLIRKGIKPAM